MADFAKVADNGRRGCRTVVGMCRRERGLFQMHRSGNCCARGVTVGRDGGAGDEVEARLLVRPCSRSRPARDDTGWVRQHDHGWVPLSGSSGTPVDVVRPREIVMGRYQMSSRP